MQITPIQLTFMLAAVITLGSALMVVSARNLLHSALWLVASLFGVAMLFALLQANFFAVVQVVVYIGAIAILVAQAPRVTPHQFQRDHKYDQVGNEERQVGNNRRAALHQLCNDGGHHQDCQ